MSDLIRFIFILLLLGLLVFLQGTRFLSIGGVNPNLIFIFFSGLILAPEFRNRMKLNFLLVLLTFTLLVGSFVSGFWPITWVVLIILILAIHFLRDFLTGRPFLDFALVLGLGTPIFYGILKFTTGSVFWGGFIIPEIIYNLVLGSVFWICLYVLGKYWYDRPRA